MLVLPEKPIKVFLSPFFHFEKCMLVVSVRSLLISILIIMLTVWKKGDKKTFIGFSGRTKLIL